MMVPEKNIKRYKLYKKTKKNGEWNEMLGADGYESDVRRWMECMKMQLDCVAQIDKYVISYTYYIIKSIKSIILRPVSMRTLLRYN